MSDYHIEFPSLWWFTVTIMHDDHCLLLLDIHYFDSYYSYDCYDCYYYSYSIAVAVIITVTIVQLL